MAWIRMIEEAEAEGGLKELYDEMIDPRVGRVDNIMKIHSLLPETMRNHYDLYRTVMYGKHGLSRVERELIAVVVSTVNHCHY